VIPITPGYLRKFGDLVRCQRCRRMYLLAVGGYAEPGTVASPCGQCREELMAPARSFENFAGCALFVAAAVVWLPILFR
jgi:hypothetical protein